jgi:hypothetical protein
MSKLDAAERSALPKRDFALPSKNGGKGGYPIEDKGHAVAAEGRVKQFGSPAEQAQVLAAVKAKFPGLVHGTHPHIVHANAQHLMHKHGLPEATAISHAHHFALLQHAGPSAAAHQGPGFGVPQQHDGTGDSGSTGSGAYGG